MMIIIIIIIRRKRRRRRRRRWWRRLCFFGNVGSHLPDCTVSCYTTPQLGCSSPWELNFFQSPCVFQSVTLQLWTLQLNSVATSRTVWLLVCKQLLNCIISPIPTTAPCDMRHETFYVLLNSLFNTVWYSRLKCQIAYTEVQFSEVISQHFIALASVWFQYTDKESCSRLCECNHAL
jgi:hypothetical protein